MTMIAFRADSVVEAALAELTSEGSTQSEAIRSALLQAAQARVDARLRAEAARLAADPDDRAEARAVLADLDPVRAW